MSWFEKVGFSPSFNGYGGHDDKSWAGAYVTGHGNSGKMPVRIHVRDCLIVRLCVRTNVRTYVRINVKMKWQDVCIYIYIIIYILCLSMFVRMVSYVPMWGSHWVASFLKKRHRQLQSIHADFFKNHWQPWHPCFQWLELRENPYPLVN